jgi:hypothetical protein
VKKDSTPITIFLLLFFKMIQLLVAEANKYNNQYLDTLDSGGGHSQLPDMAMQEMYMYVFVAIIVQMVHDVRDMLNDYWSTLEQF